MKAVRFHEYGGPEVLRHEDVERPEPGPGEVLVRVAGTSFNGVDGNIRAGFMQGPIPVSLPHVPGLDVAGTVEATGERVIGFLPMTGDGASSEYVVAPRDVLSPAPASIPLADAAAIPVVGLTAWQALFDHAGLTAGQRIAVNGAAGAVGGFAVQLAHEVGAYVIAVAGPGAEERLRERGADEVVDHTTTDPVPALAEPVDVLLNLAPVEPEQLAALVGRVRDGGVAVSTTVWMPTPSDEDREVRGIDLFVRSDTDQLAELVARIDRGELVVDVGERVALADLASVHERAGTGSLAGKVVVTVS